MARIRRIVKKVPPAAEQGFDDRLWPVNVSLLVLGSFLFGSAYAYLKSDAVWWANRLTWMLIIPLAIGGIMYGLRFVGSRRMRRAVQLACVVSVLIHVIFLIVSLESHIFSSLSNNPVATSDLVEPQRQVVVPEYARHHFVDPEQRPKEDYEKPVETKTPESTPQEIARQETQPEPKSREPQPTPVPESLPTTKPNVVQRQQPAETMPRHSEQASQLSRRQATATVRPNQTAETPQTAQNPATSSASQPQAQSSSVTRQTTDAPKISTATPTPDPASPSAQPTPTVARRDATSSPTPETTSAPTLRRQVAQPQAVPRSAATSAEAPVATQRTTDDPLKPQTTLAQKQTTASPTNQPTPTEVTPETTSQNTQTTERRQQPAEARPTLAETPVPIAPQRVRSTSRPDPATVASTATPSPTTVGDVRQPQLEAQSSAVARTTPTASAQPSRTPTEAPATPQSTSSPVATATPRRTTEATPTTTASDTPAPSMARQASPRNPSPSVATEATSLATARQTQASSLTPSATAMTKQTSAVAEVARAAGEPTPATSREATANVQVAGPARAATQSATPAVNNTAGQAPGRQSTSAMANVVTNAATVATNAGPQTTSQLAPSATASTVMRQATGAVGAPTSQPPLDAQAASPTAQVAHAGARRSTTSTAVPSLDPQAPAGNNPSRTMTMAAMPASPTNVESPAAAIAAAGTGEPTAQPTKLAMSRGAVGMVGAGASPNLDRASPAADRPALVASGSARRAEASQTTPDGPAFAPSDAPAVRRSVADASRPSGTLKAEAVEYATTGGVAVPTELTASASAAVAQSSATAASGAVSASKGTIDVDLGPTQIVAEHGAARASGGGQPELNFTNPSQMIARSKSGGAPQATIAAEEVAVSPVAPAGTSGGTPAAAFQPTATTTVRTMTGGDQPLTGGPTAGQQGPPTEVAAAPLLADAPVSRADAAEGAGGSAGGQPVLGEEDEEEKRRRLARAAAGGAPQLALQGPATIEAPAAAQPGGGGPTGQMVGPTLAAARTAPAGGPAAPAAVAGGVEAPAAGGQTAGQVVGPSRVARSEAVEASVGAPVPGGGTGSPARAGGGVTVAANTQAEVPTLAGAAQSGGAPQGSPLEAQGVATARSGEAIRGASVAGPVGAIAADSVADGRSGSAPGTALGTRAASIQSSDAPAVGQVAAGGPGPRRAAAGAAAGVGASGPIEVPALPAEVAQANSDHMGPGSGKTSTERQTGGAAVTVELAAVDGPGGLGSQATPDVGVNTRRSLDDSTQIQLRTARFQRQKAGGVLNVSTAAVVATDPFRGRTTKQPGAEGGNGSPPPQTETAIELGLAFLARYQSADGSWTLAGFNEEVQLSSDTAATALALLAFQGAGYHHREHKYKDNVRAALDYLVKNQRDDGDLFLPADDESNRSVWLYSHSIATLALCEAYGMTQDPSLKEPAQKAINFIVAGQNRERGGWRYAPGVGSDTSVTGWMMMALKSGELSGLKVPQDTYGKIRRWLDASQGPSGDTHLYRYNPYAPDTDTQRHGRAVTKTMTSVGLLMRLYSGWRRDNPNMIRGADYLQENLPAIGTARNPLRDTYYWYYATQVMFHMGGKHWEAWNGQLHPLLVNSQVKQGAFAGSWEPRGPVPDRWAEHAGRLYVTVMNLLSLEVYYRHLPLYDDTAK